MPIIFRLRHYTLQRSYVSFKDKLFHKSKSLLNVENVPVSKSPLGPLMALEIKVKSPKNSHNKTNFVKIYADLKARMITKNEVDLITFFCSEDFGCGDFVVRVEVGRGELKLRVHGSGKMHDSRSHDVTYKITKVALDVFFSYRLT